MGVINVLDSSVYNRIAAGEVVESPASVVKELVENSIDAKATYVRIETVMGGTTSIKITDNGKGMSKEDLPIAFLPHATSKIKSLNDLNEIATLGFRGEALPSIASVAKVTATSRTADSETAYTVVYDNGNLTASYESGASMGTTIEVENIFENVPARKKFLKKPSAEGAKITSIVEKLILANYNVAIEYIADGKKLYDSKGDGAESAIYTIYGEMLDNMEHVSSIMPDVTLKGYVSKPSFSKHNRNYQTLIVNGRVVENTDISYYIYVCYQDYLMKRQYPAYVLYIDIPYDMVDVNVHPNKTEIKFSNLDKIKGQIFGAIKKALTKELLVPKEISSAMLKEAESKERRVDSKALFGNLGISPSFSTARTMSTFNGNMMLGEDRNKRRINPDSSTNTTPITDKSISHKTALSEKESAETENNTLFKRNAQTSNGTQEQFQDSFDFNNVATNLSVIGKLFNTYILAQKNDCLYMIDQHAAHERLLYDKYIRCIDEGNIAVQSLLIPFVFDVSHNEKELIVDALEELARVGFTIAPFGGSSFSLSGVPSLCYNINLKDFVSTLLEKIRDGKVKKSEFIKDAVAQSACKAAVKGEDDLELSEISCLIEAMNANGGVLLCPHGRPTVIQIKRSEIEKWFKRIV